MSIEYTNNGSFSKQFADSEDPAASLQYVQHRAVKGAQTSDHIADFLDKYAEIQNEYSQKLTKLIKRQHPTVADLGTFSESFNSFLKVISTEAEASRNMSGEISNTIVPSVRNRNATKDMHRILEKAKGEEKTLSKATYKKSVLSAMDKIENIEENRLNLLRQGIGSAATLGSQRAAVVAESREKLNDSLAHFDPKQDLESYTAEIASGDIKFPNLSPAHSSGYTGSPSLNRYASPGLSPQQAAANQLRPEASPLSLGGERKESKLKQFLPSFRRKS